MGARSTSAPRTLVVGDVHGCLDELRALRRRCRLTDDDRVVFVGDLVAKGPDSAGVIAWARERGAAAVLGNHDEHVLRARAGDPAAKRPHLEVANTLSERRRRLAGGAAAVGARRRPPASRTSSSTAGWCRAFPSRSRRASTC